MNQDLKQEATCLISQRSLFKGKSKPDRKVG